MSPYGHSRRRARAFTLIELLVAIAILAIIAVLSWQGLDQVIRGRDTILRSLESEREAAQLFDQLGTDIAAAARDDELGLPAIVIGDGSLRIVRMLRQFGEPTHMQVVRYLVNDGQLLRKSSAALDSRSALNAALSSDQGDENTTTTLIASGITGFGTRIWISGTGWSAQMPTAAPVVAIAVAGSVAAPPARVITGVEASVRATGQSAPWQRVLLVGQ